MIKIVAVVRRKPELAVDAFQHYWRNEHAALVSRLPGLRRYTQSHTLASGYRKRVPAADGIAELWFDDSDALRALQGTHELASVLADEPNFLADGGSIQVLTEEHLVKQGEISPDGVKNVEFVKKKSGMTIPDFQHHWRMVHGPLGAAIKTVKRYVQSHTRAAAYADGRTPAFDGFALTWFDDVDAMRASAQSPEYAVTRADEDNFVSHPLDFIITREHLILR